MDKTTEIALPLPKKKRSTRSRFLKPLKKEFAFAIGSIPFVWQFLFFFVPFVTIVLTSITIFDESGKFLSLSLDAFSHIFTLNYFYIALNSLTLAGCTTVLTLLLGFPLAYYMAFHSGRLKQILLFLLIIPFWTNFILHIYAWFFVLEKNGFLNNVLLSVGLISKPLHVLNSYFAILLMMIYFYLPFMVLPLYSSLERFDAKLFEASLDLGANKFQTFCRILLPIMKKAIKAGIFLVFIPAFGEFVIPELMGGDKIAYVGSVISLYVLGKTTLTYGLAFTILCTFFLIITLFIVNYAIERLARSLARGSA